MKKLILMFFLVMSFSFSLEISSVDPFDFGVVVEGDRSVSLTDVGVYVEGKSGKMVEIIVPETYDLDGNKMTIRPREKMIKLDGNGNGKFRLDIKLELNNISAHETLTDNLSIVVRYLD
ncbi:MULTISPECIES: hypothetical protein [Psychrilyobacter]|uniref:Uncharacterized protein n=1 Tax=Psychrilyobacter piezotolerans TaxID=2293438 RepID=A0ABX9KL27_9FUSO|nr:MULTISPECIES: hypothetical protein [Psychrilyobacter]MCS5421066.1 hypothetical protein [Psychrilyobacter sp. S5]NDI76368.1 hypothetical protein [Psychrilyobacter piezotolerans]RDE65966.1 hypothetical protein DV867_00385 [Psychrilyobacter sp. S5]REI43144.1 hypothetical protein DYH56_00385 [Psychrilyobacter piezotolerans]